MAVMIEQAHMCPWVSILPQDQFQKLNREKEVIALIRLLVTVTLQAITHYEDGTFAHLDALVGNYGCEVHTFNLLALAHSPELREECRTMKLTCRSITQWITNRQAVLSPIEKARLYGRLDQVYTRLESESMISLKMKYLILSRLLTVTKEFDYDITRFADREYENLRTETIRLRRICQPLCIQDLVLKTIVATAQTCMSQSSIVLLRAQFEQMALANSVEGLLVKKMMSEDNLYILKQDHTRRGKMNLECTKTYSCSYYNTKAVLLLLAELQAPFTIKKMTKVGEHLEPTKVFDFRATTEIGTFVEIDHCEPNTLAMVCLAYLPDVSDQEWLHKVRTYGLGNMILAAASQGSQYVPKTAEDKYPIRERDAQQEINEQRERAKAVECVWKDKSIFDLDHFYCTPWRLRAENIGENHP